MCNNLVCIPCVFISRGFFKVKWGNCNIFFKSIIGVINIISEHCRFSLLKHECLKIIIFMWNLGNFILHLVWWSILPYIVLDFVTHIKWHIVSHISAECKKKFYYCFPTPSYFKQKTSLYCSSTFWPHICGLSNSKLVMLSLVMARSHKGFIPRVLKSQWRNGAAETDAVYSVSSQFGRQSYGSNIYINIRE